MKKKAIEKIAPLPVEKSKDRKIYVAAVKVVSVRKEEYLIVDIYRNLKKCFKEPIIRIALSSNGYGAYVYKIKEWIGAMWDNIPVVHTQYISGNTASIQSENTSIKEKYKEIVRNAYLKTHEGMYMRDDWLKWINDMEYQVNVRKSNESFDRRMDRLKYRDKNTKPLDEEFNQYARSLFDNKHIIFYKRKGRYAQFTCSSCGQTYRYATTSDGTYEGEFEKVVNIPKHGCISRCEKCDASGHYMAIGKKDKVEHEKTIWVVDKYLDDGIVAREINLTHVCDRNTEKLYITEQMRYYFENGSRMQKDYNLYDGWGNSTSWYDKNYAGMRNLKSYAGIIYPPSYKVIAESHMKYCSIQEYAKRYETINVGEYLTTYSEYPQLEMLIKLGFTKTANKILDNRWYLRNGYFDTNAKSVAGLFKINKTKVAKLREHGGSLDCLRLLQMEKELNIDIKSEYEDALIQIQANIPQLRTVMGIMSVKRLFNQLSKYADIPIDTILDANICSNAYGYLQIILNKYLDYLDMRIELGYDMSNQIYLKPHNLDEAHDKMVLESSKEKCTKRVREVNKKYTNIKKMYKRLCERYMYQDDEYVIRPAKSAGEIVQEGQMLHHCVGGDSYLIGHDQGKSLILFLRFLKKPNTPYITIQINDTKIVQWYGAYDKKPNEKNNQIWLDNYIEMLKNESIHKNKNMLNELPAAV